MVLELLNFQFLLHVWRKGLGPPGYQFKCYKLFADDLFEMGRTGAEGEDKEDEDEDIDQSEVQRRKERLEREQWLREQVGSAVYCSSSSVTHVEKPIIKEKLIKFYSLFSLMQVLETLKL